jgi:hypothetical protein
MSRGANQHNDLYYQAKWKSVANVLWHSNLDVSLQRQRLDSDMDVIFSAAGNPSKQIFYPKLITLMKSNFPEEHVYPGSNYNVVHMDFKSGGKFDLVLLPENQFNREHKEDVDYRRKNL